MNTYSNKSIKLFFTITIFLSVIAEAVICTTGQPMMYLVLMWIPAFAAFIANCLRLREASEIITPRKLLAWGNIHRCKIRYILLGCLLPLIYLLIPYLVYWNIHPGTFAYNGVPLHIILSDCLPITVIGIFSSLLSALGEEIGWRGFMAPALYEKIGLNKMLVISSLFWCCWHLPILTFGDYMSGTPVWYKLPAFILCIFPVGVMAGLLAIRSKSLWPAAFLHAAHNNYDQTVFGIITIGGSDRMYFVSETGILTVLCAWTLAITLYLGTKKQLNAEA